MIQFCKKGTALIAGSLLLTLVGSIQLAAQTPTASTCPTPPTGLTTLNLERALTLPDILFTHPLNLPANIQASIAAGAQEIREILVYNSQRSTVTSTVFLVASGAPLPTPNFDFQTGVIQSTTVTISQILVGTTPFPSLLLVGTVTNSSTTGAFASLNGAPAVISIGYTTDTPPKITDVAEIISGVVDVWSAAGTGTVTFPVVPVIPPGSTGNSSIIVTSPGLGNLTSSEVKAIQVSQSQILLDASGSTGSGPLTFNFSTTGAPVNFQATGKPGQVLVTLPGKGEFKIMLTVTDSAGITSPPFFIVLQFV